MNINKLLQGVDCPCGKRHTCKIECVYIENGVARRLRELCSMYDEILLIADENTYRAAGERVEAELRDKKLKRVIFSGDCVLIPNEEAVATVLEASSGVTAILGVGSGVIQDLAKYVSHITSLPYMIFATAPSMDGYASDGAAMILGGMKETVKAGLPRAILADPEVLKDAPMEMIVAGYGDIVGKYSALNDWRLSALINGEYFCDFIYNTTSEMIEKTLTVHEGILARDEKVIQTLMEALIVVGIMMSFAGTSRPASGSEHHLSHFFEIVGIVKNEPYLPHGIDVAYSTLITAKIRQALISTPFTDTLYREQKEILARHLKEIYGSVGESCLALQEKIGSYNTSHARIYQAREEEIKAILRDTKSAEEIESILTEVGLDQSRFYDLYGTKKIETAIRYAKDLKDRYTVLWLFYDLGGEFKH